MQALRLIIVPGGAREQELRQAALDAGVSLIEMPAPSQPWAADAVLILGGAKGARAGGESSALAELPTFVLGEAPAAGIAVQGRFAAEALAATVIAGIILAIGTATAAAVAQVDRRIEAFVDERMRDLARVLADDNGVAAQVTSATDAVSEAPTARPPGLVPAFGGSAAGDIEDDDLLVLLGRAHLEAATGQLVVTADGVERSLFFEAGRVVLVTSTAVEDRLVEALAGQGRITAEQKVSVLERTAHSGRRTGAVLVELGLLKSEELSSVIREHQETVLLSAFASTHGQWRFDAMPMAEGHRGWLLRHPAALARDGLARRHPSPRLVARLGPEGNVLGLRRGAAASSLLEDFAFDAREARAAALFDGVRSLREVRAAAGVTENEVYRVAAALEAFGLLAGAALLDEPFERATAQRDRAVDRRRVLARFALACEGDYFAVLGVGPDARTGEIDRALARVRKELLPAELGAVLAAELARELEVIGEVLAEAVRVLGCESLRALYRASLVNAVPATAATQAASAAS